MATGGGGFTAVVINQKGNRYKTSTEEIEEWEQSEADQFLELVEAAGVEPASENSGDPAPTCLALAWISSAFCPESRKQTRTSLAVFVIRGEAGRESLAHIHDTRRGDVSNHRVGRRSPN